MISGGGPYDKPQTRRGKGWGEAKQLVYCLITGPSLRKLPRPGSLWRKKQQQEVSRANRVKPQWQSSASSKLVKWPLSYPSINTRTARVRLLGCTWGVSAVLRPSTPSWDRKTLRDPVCLDGCVVLCVFCVPFILISGSTVRQEEKRQDRFSGCNTEGSTDSGPDRISSGQLTDVISQDHMASKQQTPAFKHRPLCLQSLKSSDAFS